MRIPPHRFHRLPPARSFNTVRHAHDHGRPSGLRVTTGRGRGQWRNINGQDGTKQVGRTNQRADDVYVAVCAFVSHHGAGMGGTSKSGRASVVQPKYVGVSRAASAVQAEATSAGATIFVLLPGLGGLTGCRRINWGDAVTDCGPTLLLASFALEEPPSAAAATPARTRDVSVANH